MEEGEAEAAPEVEEEPSDVGGQEEEEEAQPPSEGPDAEVEAEVLTAEESEQTTVPVKARIICGSSVEPLTIGKALVPGGSPLHMEIPGAGTLVLTASLKAPPPSEPETQPETQPETEPETEPEPTPAGSSLSASGAAAGPAGEVKCLCPTGKRRPGADDQIKALATTMDQISSMQQLLSDMQSKAQQLSEQLATGGRGPPLPPPLPPPQPMGVPRLPYDVPGGMQVQPRAMQPADFPRVPPGGKEVFSAPGVGIYVVQKDAPPMVGGSPYEYMPPAPDPRPMQPGAVCPQCDNLMALPPPSADLGQRDWAAPAPMPPSQSRGAEPYMPGGGGHVCCGGGGGGQMVCCGGGGGCCGGGRIVCCGGGVKIACCGGGGAVSCCGARVNTCCGGGGGGGGGPYQQQQPGGYSRLPDAEQQLALCQGDCSTPCDSGATCGVGRTR